MNANQELLEELRKIAVEKNITFVTATQIKKPFHNVDRTFLEKPIDITTIDYIDIIKLKGIK